MSTLGFTSPEDFFNMPPEVIAYTVENLLPSSGLSVWVAKPKIAKSTILRQLAVSVAKGKAFLGRAVDQGGVLYLALEEKPSEVQGHLKQLGFDSSDPIYVRCGAVERSDALVGLESAIKDRPNVKLVIIDTLFQFVSGVRDSNDYQQVNLALGRLRELARRCDVHIATAHHAKKKETEDSRDGILGSTAIAGGVDSLLLLRAQKNGVRTLSTIQRYGDDMPETELCWDAETRSMSVGNTLSENRQLSSAEIRERMENETLAYIREHPEGTQAEILSAVHGNGTVRREVFDQIVESGFLARSGSGVKGAPFRYSVLNPPYIIDSAVLAAA
jgi:hypothetical protein